MLVGALMLSKKNKNNPIRKSGYLTFTTLQYGILAGLRSANVEVAVYLYIDTLIMS